MWRFRKPEVVTDWESGGASIRRNSRSPMKWILQKCIYWHTLLTSKTEKSSPCNISKIIANTVYYNNIYYVRYSITLKIFWQVLSFSIFKIHSTWIYSVFHCESLVSWIRSVKAIYHILSFSGYILWIDFILWRHTCFQASLWFQMRHVYILQNMNVIPSYFLMLVVSIYRIYIYIYIHTYLYTTLVIIS